MSNNTNLSKLANVLDDGSSGQYLKSTGSGGVVFDTVAAGTTTVADLTALEALSAAQGDMAFVLSNNNVYIRKTAGWYKIATVTNDQLQSVTVTMSGGGTAGDPYELALDGTDTLATGAATDPEGLSVTWSAAAISPATLSGNNIVVSSVNVATITQGTGASSNVFTIDPVATTGTHNFSLRFSVTDGINATINTDKAYTLNFVTSVLDSNHTTLLAKAVGANNGTNSSIIDSGGSNTVSDRGSLAAGTFSPYRSGGYSTYFGSGIYLSSTMTAIGTSNYTIEMWVNLESISGSPMFLDGRYNASQQGYGNGGLGVRLNSSGQLWVSTTQSATVTGTTVLSTDTWHHIMVVRSGTGTNEFKVYLDGSLEVQGTDANSKTATWFTVGAAYTGGNSPTGYIRDLRISTTARSTTTPTAPVEADSDTIWLGCSLPYIADASSSSSSVTITGDLETRPFGPYDYSEYSAANHGGSILFDGSDDYLLVDSNTSLGSGTWTLQGWVYMNSNSRGTIFDFRPPSTQGYYVRFYYQSNGIRFYENSTDRITSNDTVPIKTWTHVALVRDTNNVIKLYINGKVQTQTYTSSSNYLSAQERPVVGASGNNSNYDRMNGYLSDLKVTIGTAEYTANFTPPTSPMSSSNSEVHLKGTDASIIDNSSSTGLTLLNNTVSSTTQAKFANTKSIYFDGSGDRLMTKGLPDIGNSDFTVEMWMYETSHDNNAGLFDLRGVLGSGHLLFSHSGDIRWEGPGTGLFSSGSSLSTNTWYHIALCRQGSSTKIFIDGSQTGSTLTDTNNYVAGTDRPILGGNGYNLSGGHFTGYLQDIRLTIGKARYTSNFSVPTAPLEG